MKAWLVTGALVLAAVQACDARTPAGEAAASAPTAVGTDAAYRLVDGLLKTPRLLQQPWAQMRQAFPAGCSKAADAPELDCPPMEGIARISAVDSGSGMVDVVFTPAISCERLYEVIRQRIGPGRIEGGDKCVARWQLAPAVPRGHVRLSRGKRDPSRVNFQMAIEQGP